MFVLNNITISGNLTRDPELRSTPSGTSVCKLSIAVNERIKKGDNWEDYPSYIDITAWASLGEQMAKQLQKGSPVAVQGQIRQDRWKAEDGSNRSKVYVVARAFFAPKGSGSNGQGSFEADVPADTAGLAGSGQFSNDDIPFN